MTLSAYRELNKSSGQSILKSEFTKWVLRFAAGRSGSASAAPSSAEVALSSTLEEFRIVAPSKASASVYDDEVDPADAVAGDGEENSRDELETRAVETIKTPEVDASAPDEGQRGVSVPLTVPADEDTANPFAGDRQDHDEAIEATELQEDEDQETQVDETQEYEQEFTPETPRAADAPSELAASPETQENNSYDADAGAEHFEADAVECASSLHEADFPSTLQDERATATEQTYDGLTPEPGVSEHLGDEPLPAVDDTPAQGDCEIPSGGFVAEQEAPVPALVPELEPDASYEVRRIECWAASLL